MNGMDMGAFDDAYQRSLENAGITFGDVDRLVIRNELTARLVGTMASVWEHFAETAKGVRPFYCQGPSNECEMCALAAQWGMSDDVTLQEQAKDIKAKERYYFNVLDRSVAGRALHVEKKHTLLLSQNEKGLNVGSMVLQAIGSVVNMRKSQGQPADPNGFDLQFTKTGKGFQTRYGANFTGNVDPLTPEEVAYEMYDLGPITALSPVVDIAAAVAYMKSSPADRAAVSAESTSFDTSKMQAAGDPAQAAREAMANTPSTTEAVQPAAVPIEPAAQPVQPAQPAAALVQPAQPAAVPAQPVTAPVTQYASTIQTPDVNTSTHYQVPCSDCGVQMWISMTDTRDLQCHGCQKVYSHPKSASKV